MFMDTTGALAREHIADLHARAARHNLASQARRARVMISHRSPGLTRSAAATDGAVGPCAACRARCG